MMSDFTPDERLAALSLVRHHLTGEPVRVRVNSGDRLFAALADIAVTTLRMHLRAHGVPDDRVDDEVLTVLDNATAQAMEAAVS